MFPLFLLASGISIYLNQHYHKIQMLEQTKRSVITQALIIRESLANMMLNNERVDDEYLEKISQIGELKDLHVCIVVDSLRLNPEFLTPERLKRLKQREKRWSGKRCLINNPSIFSAEPMWFFERENLEAIIPIKADEKCQTCHNVPTGAVLGAAHINISLSESASAIRANTIRSILIFIAFIITATLLGTFIFSKFVSKPVQELIKATEIVGSGNLDYIVDIKNSSAEISKLADSFNKMRKELKKAQNELIKKERLSLVGQMASSIIHDFRNPMGTIRSAIEILQTKKNIPRDKLNRYYNMISSSVERMNRMIQELLDFSKGEQKLELKLNDVSEFVKNIISGVSISLERKKINLIIEQNYKGKAIFDQLRLQRAIINIINNAEEAMSDGGEIRFKIYKEDETLVFKISDTGKGIPEDIKDKIFDPFVTSGKSGGTGLGLAITKKIIEQHGGKISFESERNKGTTFIVKIPLRR
jgi:signal transduction histidine kinase